MLFHTIYVPTLAHEDSAVSSSICFRTELSSIIERMSYGDRTWNSPVASALSGLLAWLYCVMLACCWLSSAQADVFVLTSGGEVRGEWMNRTEKYAAQLEVRMPEGLIVVIPAKQLKERIRELPDIAEYERMAPTFANTVEEQWKLAEWCREKSLKLQRETHLKSILALEPNHAQARHLLGYQQFRHQWQTSQTFHERDGYEKIAGRWQLKQDVQIHAEQAQQEQAEKEWLVKMKRWRSDFTSERSEQAIRNFEELRDPLAVPGLVWLCKKEQEKRAKLVFLDALLRIALLPAMQGWPATHALLELTLSEPSEAMYRECVDRVLQVPPHTIQKSLVDTLRNTANQRLNRAAYMLGKIGDARVCAPLIEALVTKQRVATGDNPDQTNTSFTGNGGVGLSRGGPAVIEVPVQNRDVLEALVTLTQQNFNYDQRAWRYWYDLEKDRIFRK